MVAAGTPSRLKTGGRMVRGVISVSEWVIIYKVTIVTRMLYHPMVKNADFIDSQRSYAYTAQWLGEA